MKKGLLLNLLSKIFNAYNNAHIMSLPTMIAVMSRVCTVVLRPYNFSEALPEEV